MAHGQISHAGEDHGSVAQYLTGYGLSVILTAAAFLVVMQAAWSPAATATAITVLAATQIVVHLYYFLHLNASSAQRWNVMASAFTVVIAAIVIGGTLWVMHNANENMTPQMSTHQMAERSSFCIRKAPTWAHSGIKRSVQEAMPDQRSDRLPRHKATG